MFLASATLRHTVQTERNIKQRSISTVYPIFCITDSSLWRSFVRIGSENKAAENPNSSETNYFELLYGFALGPAFSENSMK